MKYSEPAHFTFTELFNMPVDLRKYFFSLAHEQFKQLKEENDRARREVGEKIKR